MYELMQDAGGAAIPDLILATGQPQFGPRLLDWMGEQTGTDLLSVFALDRLGPPRLLLALGGPLPAKAFPWTASTRYAEEFWRYDPTFSKIVHAFPPPGAHGMHRQSGSAIANGNYRAACYEQPRVLERLSLYGQPGGMKLMVNLYRLDRHGPFTAAATRAIGQRAATILALVGKNAALDDLASAPALHPSLDTVCAALKARAPRLSAREAEVCAALLVGLSLKEIAHCTGLEPSSIVTYRKRAYAKLAITTRRDLARIYDPSAAAKPRSWRRNEPGPWKPVLAI